MYKEGELERPNSDKEILHLGKEALEVIEKVHTKDRWIFYSAKLDDEVLNSSPILKGRWNGIVEVQEGKPKTQAWKLSLWK